MARIEASDAVEMIKRMAAPCPVEIDHVNSDTGHIEIRTTQPGKLIGKNGGQAKEFKANYGWSMRIHLLADDANVALDKLENWPGFRRAQAVRGQHVSRIESIFNRHEGPSRADCNRFEEETGWKLGFREESSPIPIEHAFEVANREYPNGGLVAYEESIDGVLILYSINSDMMPVRGSEGIDRLGRMTGWPAVDVRATTTLSDASGHGGNVHVEYPERLELEIMRKRCGGCLGSGTTARPTIYVDGMSWEARVCPACGGSGDRRRRRREHT